MNYTLDYFVARLKCPVCGNITESDASTNMQTKIRENPELAYLSIGTPLSIDFSTMRESGYLTVETPMKGEPIRILQTWDCPFCGTPMNWAEIVIKDDVIQSITAVTLDRETLERAHFISEDVIYIVMDLTGLSFTELAGKDIVPILRSNL